MTYVTWREKAAPIITAVIREVGRSDMKKLRAALRSAYPFGERKNFPYKVWCSDVRYQISGYLNKRGAKRIPPAPNQKDLFQ